MNLLDNFLLKQAILVGFVVWSCCINAESSEHFGKPCCHHSFLSRRRRLPLVPRDRNLVINYWMALMTFAYIAKMSRGIVGKTEQASRQNYSMRWNSNAVDTAGIFQFGFFLTNVAFLDGYVTSKVARVIWFSQVPDPHMPHCRKSSKSTYLIIFQNQEHVLERIFKFIVVS